MHEADGAQITSNKPKHQEDSKLIKKIPLELIRHITGYLSNESKASLALSCKRLAEVLISVSQPLARPRSGLPLWKARLPPSPPNHAVPYYDQTRTLHIWAAWQKIRQKPDFEDSLIFFRGIEPAPETGQSLCVSCLKIYPLGREFWVAWLERYEMTVLGRELSSQEMRVFLRLSVTEQHARTTPPSDRKCPPCRVVTFLGETLRWMKKGGRDTTLLFPSC